MVGGGLAGISAAIHLAEAGMPCTLFDAAPTLGGRANSFFEPTAAQWVDHGPHLVMGCYHHLLGLLARAGNSNAIHWQPSLTLALWSADRGHFRLAPSRRLPLPLAMPLAIGQLPGHNLQSAFALVRLASQPPADTDQTALQWLAMLNIPHTLIRDLIEPLCLGSMNEAIATANAASFSQVLSQAFTNQHSARLGWFTRPLCDALIQPLLHYAKQCGVILQPRCCIQRLERNHDHWLLIDRLGKTLAPCSQLILAVAPSVRDRLLNRTPTATDTGVISNLHLWFDHPLTLPYPLVGGIGTQGQWFIDVNGMMNGNGMAKWHHYCIIMSAENNPRRESVQPQLLDELATIANDNAPPTHARLVRMAHATHLVRRHNNHPMPHGIIDGAEQPKPGELPATLELAVMRGQRAAARILEHS
ncbi:MAG: FAD-dependent oxidoreductase [Mariprofundales bacterium]|nr:FAD-dependent oxidoreductase [Mariprofundales bacterium]